MRSLSFLLLLISSLCFAITIKVGVYHNPPLIDFENQKASGLYVEIVEQVALQNNWEVRYVFGDFSWLVEQLRDGQIDLLTAIAYTQSRAEIFDFNNQAVIINWGVLCSKKTVNSLLDLQNKIIALMVGDVYAESLKRQIEDFKLTVRYFHVEDYEKALQAVQKDMADLCVVSRIFAYKNAPRYSLQMSGIVFSPVELRFAFTKNTEKSQTLIEAFDRYLSKMKSDQLNYNLLLSRYLGTHEEKTVLPLWLLFVLISSCLVIFIFLLWVFLLRKAVAARTKQLSESVREIKEKKEELLAANEEISAQAEELERLNKELEMMFEDLKTTVQRFNNSIDLFGQITAAINDEEFFLKFLLLVRSIVPECSVVYVHRDLSYGRIKDDGMEFISVKRMQRGETLPSGRFQGIPSQVEITLKNKVYETICLASEDNSHLMLFNHRELPLEEEIIELVKTTLNITKVFLKMKDYEDRQRNFFKKISDVLLTVLNYHESYTAVHSARTSEYAAKIAQRILLRDESVEKVYWAGLIHDIGKIAIPREVLCKPSKLSPEEYEMVKTHSIVASELLAKAGLDELAKIVRHHHERFDGNGYPDGLKAEQIPIESRIIAVVDAYDAMTSDRPYRRALSDQQAIEELKKNAGSQFDPLVVNTFIDILKES